MLKLTNPFLGLGRAGIAAVGLAVLSTPPSALATSPTLRVSIVRSANRNAVVTWGPPQATLQRSPNVTGGFVNVPEATTPYLVDTRLAPARGYRACLSVSQPTIFIWRDTILQPGRIAIEWSPRDWRLQETGNFVQWQASGAPATDWYYPPTPLDPPAAGRVFAGARVFRIVPAAAAPAPAGPVFSVNYLGYANLAFQVGRSNYFSWPLQHPDRNLNTLLPLPLEADGTFLQFYDVEAESFGLPVVFDPIFGGWAELDGSPAFRPAGEIACMIFPQSSTPGSTTVVSTMIGELAQGGLRRTLPPGYSLNGPLVPQQGGLTTTHNLRPNEGDVVFLFNTATRMFDPYEYFSGLWLPDEPVVGPADAFFYLNTSGLPLDWVRVFQLN